MSLEVAIAENTAALNNLLAFLKSNPLPVGAASTAADKPAPAKPSTTKPQQPTEVVTHGTSANTKLPEVEAATQATAPTAQQVTEAALALAKAKGRDALVKLLGEFGVAKTPELKPEQFSDFVTKATKAKA